jgi:protoporphyrinogen oxidase
MRVAVIGAGPAGITAAYQLSKAGVAVQVFEAGSAVGGMARTIELWGQRVDLGPHRFFSDDPRVTGLWREVVGPDYRMVDRLTRIYFRRRFFHYPLRPFNALRNMGLTDAARCVASYFREQVVPSARGAEAATFESWVVNRFGRRLFEMFFKSYSEKLWGIPCDELDADFAAQRIKKFSLGAALKSALGFGGEHKTLVDRFAYPVSGTGMVYERMAERVRAAGGAVRLRTPVRRVVHEGTRVQGVELTDGRIEPFDHVISTMPLTHAVAGLDDVPARVRAAAGALRFRNTILVYLHVNGRDLFPDQWLYVHSPELRVGRVTNFRNWVPELYGGENTTVLALEYWCNDDDPEWTESDGALTALATREMTLTGLLGGAPVLGGHVIRISRCYPMYARGYKDLLAPVVEHLRQFRGLTPIGRYGSFKYNNQDHSILMGMLAAENVLGAATHDLWSVNSDYESYQEAKPVCRTGLEDDVPVEPASHVPEPVTH